MLYPTKSNIGICASLSSMCGIISGLCFLMHGLNLRAIIQEFSTQKWFWSALCTYKSLTVGRENGCCTKDSNDNSCRQAVHLAHSDSCYKPRVQVTIAFLNPVIVVCTIGIISP